MVIFILNVLLNIEKLYFDFCECEDEKICYPCFMAGIYDEDQVYNVYKNCLDLDFLCQFKENLYLHMCQLFEKKKKNIFPSYFVDMDFVANVKKLIAETHENDFEVKYYPYPTTAKFQQNPQQVLQATTYMPQKIRKFCRGRMQVFLLT